MTQSLYAILDQDARQWWYHQDLRKAGKATEARKRERDSILSHVKTLRQALQNGGYASVGRGGWSIHISDGHKLQGYGQTDEPMIQAAILVGLPVVDSTTISGDDIFETIRMPMVGISHHDQPPYRSLDYAPLKVVAKMYQDLGATIYNLDLDS